MSDAEQPKRARGRPTLSKTERRLARVKSSYRSAEFEAVERAAALADKTVAVFQRIAAINLAKRVTDTARRGQPRSPYGG